MGAPGGEPRIRGFKQWLKPKRKKLKSAGAITGLRVKTVAAALVVAAIAVPNVDAVRAEDPARADRATAAVRAAPRWTSKN
jgi:hypothetical protein